MRDYHETEDERLELGASEDEQADDRDLVIENELRPMCDRWAEWVDFIDR